MKKNSGITLIVLVLTIIILLILAGVTINTFTSENNIINNAGYAKFATEIKAIEEKIDLKSFEYDENNSSGQINDELNIVSNYNDLLYIEEGKIVYIPDKASKQEKEWLEKLGINPIGKNFKITFETNGGTEVKEQNITTGKKAIKPNNPILNGKEFLYWYYNKNIGTEENPNYIEEIFDFENEITQDYVLYAKYTGRATLVNYNLNTYFWQYRDEITSVSFEKGETTIPDNVLYSWHLEKSSNCYPIIAYIINNGDEDPFRLIVKSDRDIYADASICYFFKDFRKVKSIDLTNFDTSNTTDMKGLFYASKEDGAYPLEKIVFGEKFDTSNVTNMLSMFRGCSNLVELDVSKFDTSKVTTMTEMFCRCNKLENLDVSNFDTSNVTSMDYMFFYCRNINKLDLSKFDTSKVTNMECMFFDCEKIENLDLSSFNTNRVEKMTLMFGGCYALNKIYTSNTFITTNVASSDNMFKNSTKIVGGSGTIYNSSKLDKEYARIDSVENPGYFTEKIINKD